MRVKNGDRTGLETPAKAEPADRVITSDYYTQLPQIRLTGNATGHPAPPGPATEVTLDGNDVARLVECALRHPAANMRYAVLAAIWSHPESFREIFRFGLNASSGFPEIRKIVTEELEKGAAAPASPGPDPGDPAGKPLLPRMPLPAHLRGRKGQ